MIGHRVKAAYGNRKSFERSVLASFPAFLALAVFITAMPVAKAESLLWQGAKDCRFMPPESLGTGKIEWVGSCSAGKANGMGMLKPRGADAPEATFYGRIKDGQPEAGVIEVPGGFKAGPFINGDTGTTDTMDERDEMFEIAAQAAEFVSETYSKKNNQASSGYYKKKAEELLLQIE